MQSSTSFTYLFIGNRSYDFSERKRDADEVDDIIVPDSKKPRFGGSVNVDEIPDSHSSPSATELAQPFLSTPAQYEKRKSRGKIKANVKDSGNAFKENPYTFLVPDDPILLSCMLVSFRIHLS